VKAGEPWNAAALAVVLAAQGIELKPGRAERVARGVQDVLAALAADPLRRTVEFEAEPCSCERALSRWRTA